MQQFNDFLESIDDPIVSDSDQSDKDLENE